MAGPDSVPATPPAPDAGAASAPGAGAENLRLKPKHKPRVRLLDNLRGFSVVSMVAFHAMYDLVYMYGLKADWYRGLPGYLWQQSICWVFILVAGASLHYGRHRWRHALTVLGCACLLTLVTGTLMPNMLIVFGVLHMLALSMVLAAALHKPLQRVNPKLGLAVCAALFILLRRVPYGGLGLLDWQLISLPAAWYRTSFLFPLGLPGPDFFSTDYFPLIPWTFLFFAGYFGWALLKPRARAKAPTNQPFELIGRHSLLIYMLHQPVIYGVLTLLDFAGLL
ncbi:DUF1624 domain-containing protein [Ruminococcaceae bacterium OttesenSCG-928-D13]|nr:DUF1624 domain-containing protein [Ruminococcaceae bacterium OttesenSCG-928-D13]